MYDYLIVGAGLFGATFAYEMNKQGKHCLVIDKRQNVGGNIYSERIDGIHVHQYGPHIFHTKDKTIWEYINQFSTFNSFVYQPVACIEQEVYNMPFNMNTFSKMWPGVITPEDAIKKIESQKEVYENGPTNLEEQAISLVGRDLYFKLVKGYTEKQWGRDCKELPSFIIKRLPVRFTYDNNYFNDPYQGIPVDGYTKIIEKMLEGIEVRLSIDFLENRDEYCKIAKHIIYTGPIDQYYDYCFGALQYRSLRFETTKLDISNYQGCAAVNYTGHDAQWTRIVEHKWFNFGKDENGNEIPTTVITKEYSAEWSVGDEPYYPINDDKNNALYNRYKELAGKDSSIIFAGRLGTYQYLDMDQVIKSALDLVHSSKW